MICLQERMMYKMESRVLLTRLTIALVGFDKFTKALPLLLSLALIVELGIVLIHATLEGMPKVLNWVKV